MLENGKWNFVEGSGVEAVSRMIFGKLLVMFRPQREKTGVRRSPPIFHLPIPQNLLQTPLVLPLVSNTGTFSRDVVLPGSTGRRCCAGVW